MFKNEIFFFSWLCVRKKNTCHPHINNDNIFVYFFLCDDHLYKNWTFFFCVKLSLLLTVFVLSLVRNLNFSSYFFDYLWRLWKSNWCLLNSHFLTLTRKNKLCIKSLFKLQFDLIINFFFFNFILKVTFFKISYAFEILIGQHTKHNSIEIDWSLPIVIDLI